MKLLTIKNLTEKHLYIIAIISVATLILANQVVIQRMLGQIERDDLEIYAAFDIYTSSQKLLKLAYMTLEHEDTLPELKMENETLYEKFTTFFGVESSDRSRDVHSPRLNQLNSSIKPYHEQIHASIQGLNSVAELSGIIASLDRVERNMLPIMEDIIFQLDEETVMETESLARVELGLALMSLLILWLEFQYIFKPIISELKSRELRLQKLNLSKDQILATVAHDVRNPLSAIHGTLQILIKDLGELSEDNRLMMELSIESCQKAESLIQELLDISLLESEEFHLQTELTHLEQYLTGILSQFKLKADDKHIALKMNIDPKDLSLNIDKAQFSRAIENLITNAIKFTKDSGKVEVLSHRLNDKVMIEVRDNGIGVPDKLKTYIFEKFSKARRTGTEGEGTTGLGMSIVKTIVEKHGGTIDLDSQEGRGTVFYITLPTTPPPGGTVKLSGTAR